MVDCLPATGERSGGLLSVDTGVHRGCPRMSPGVEISLGATDRLRCLHQQRSPARKGPRVSEIGSATIQVGTETLLKGHLRVPFFYRALNRSFSFRISLSTATLKRTFCIRLVGNAPSSGR